MKFEFLVLPIVFVDIVVLLLPIGYGYVLREVTMTFWTRKTRQVEHSPSRTNEESH